MSRRARHSLPVFDEAFLDSFPLLAPIEEIKRVVRYVQLFFGRTPVVGFSAPINSVQYFAKPYCKSHALSLEEQHRLDGFVDENGSKKRMLRYLVGHPELCRHALSRIPLTHFRSNKKNGYFSELLQIALHADSIDMFRLAMVETVQPQPKKWKGKIGRVVSYIQTPDLVPGLFLQPEEMTANYRHGLDNLASATAFAASPTKMFVGKTGGMVRILKVGEGKDVDVGCKTYRATSGLYSLVWMHAKLWMITQTSVYMIDVTLSETVKVENNPEGLTYPVCTDGQYLYAFNGKKMEVMVFAFSARKSVFEFVRKIKLSFSLYSLMPLASSEDEIIFAVDGGIISFMNQKKRDATFRQYSLVTGKFISDETITGFAKIMGWCTRPFTNQHVVLMESELAFYEGMMQMSRSLIGVPRPCMTENNLVLEALELAVFHGAPFFVSGSIEGLSQLMNYYCALGVDAGVRTIGQIFLRFWGLKQTKGEEYAHFFADDYTKCSSKPGMQRFCCFMYLVCVSDGPVSYVRNVLSDYAEIDDVDLEFVLVYPKAVDFRDSRLSVKAARRLVSMCTSRWNEFGNEVNYLLDEFLREYASARCQQGDITDMLEPLGAIMNAIETNMRIMITTGVTVDITVMTGQYAIWGCVLRIVVGAREYWPRYGHKLIPLLRLGMVEHVECNHEMAKANIMMTRTMCILLEMLCALPRAGLSIRFKTRSAFYAAFPSVMNGYNSELDQLLIDILDKAYDLCSKMDYDMVLSEARKIVLFQCSGDLSALKRISDIDNLSGFGIISYLRNGTLETLARVDDFEIVNTCLAVLFPRKSTMMEDQLIVSGIFLYLLSVHSFDTTGLDFGINPDSYSGSLYFLMPRKVLLQHNERLSPQWIMKIRVDMLAWCFDNIVAVYSRIDDAEELFTPLLNSTPQDQKGGLSEYFTNPAMEPDHFKNALLWLIPIEAGVCVDYSNFLQVLPCYLWTGSCRVIDTILRGIVCAEKQGVEDIKSIFKIMCDIVWKGCIGREEVFIVRQVGIAYVESLFTIIHYMKVMFNSVSGVFRKYISSYASSATPDEAVVVFAIMNNSIESLRKGVEAHFRYESVDVMGVTNSVDAKELCFKIGASNYSISSAVGLWCKSLVEIDVGTVTDVSAFVELFERTRYESTVLNVFYYSSLMEFFKWKTIISLFSPEFRAEFMKVPDPPYVQPESLIQDFLSYLRLPIRENLQLPEIPPFSFTPIDAPVQERPAFVPIHDGHSGFLVSLESTACYMSSPIHPQCAMHVELTMISNFKDDEDDLMKLMILGTCPSISGTLRTEIFTVRRTQNEDVVVDIAFDPVNRLIVVSIGDEPPKKTAVCPVIDMLYFMIDIRPGMVVSYNYDYKRKAGEVNAFPKCCSLLKDDVHDMEPMDQSFRLPGVDSPLFNNIQAEETARRLVNSLRFVMAYHIRKCKRRKMSAKLAVELLLSANCCPEHNVVSIADLTSRKLWLDLGDRFIRLVCQKHRHFTWKKLWGYVQKRIIFYTQGALASHNRSAMVVKSKRNVRICVTNSYIFKSSMGMQTAGFGRSYFAPDKRTLVVPYEHVTGTVAEVVALSRYFVMLSIMKGEYDFSGLIAALSEVTRVLPFTNELFRSTVRLINDITPVSPSFGLRSCEDTSFFVRESLVHKRPDMYLVQRFVDYSKDCLVFKEGDIPRSFDMPDAREVYVGLRTIGESISGSIEIHVGDETQTVAMNSFVLLKNGVFSITGNDSLTCAEIVVCENPAYADAHEALLRWQPRHSHQLIYSLIDQDLSEALFSTLPLSTMFTYETTCFILWLLKNANASGEIVKQQSSGTPLGRDFRRGSMVRRVASMMNCATDMMTSSFNESSSFSALPAIFTVSGPSQHIVSDPDACEWCVSRSSRRCREYVDFMNYYGLGLFDSVHPDFVRATLQSRDFFVTTPYPVTVKGVTSGNPIEEWLNDLIARMPRFIVLMLAEFVTGKIFVADQSPFVINMLFTETKDSIEVIHDLHILIVGQFASSSLFQTSLLARLDAQ